METLHPFEEELYQRVKSSILSWDAQEREDTYALLLQHEHVWSADSSGRDIAYQGIISLNHNTEAHWRSQVPQAPTPMAARWNVVYWPTEWINLIPHLPAYEEDPEESEMRLRDDWCAAMALVPEGVDGTGRPIYPATLFFALLLACQKVGQHLHQSGFVENMFGKPIPILVSGDGPADACAAATQAASPANLSQAYEEFLLGQT